MVDVFQDLERLRHDIVPLLALDVRHKTQPAGVVLVGGRIQTVLLQMLYLGGRGHGTFLIYFAGDTRLVHCSIPVQEE